jgi:ribonuclease P/MRP protein subunit POP1
LLVKSRFSFKGQACADFRYEGGAQVANVDFYEHENVPHGLIGPAQVIWKPSSASDSTEPRTVWLRVHPSIFDAVYQAVRASAGLGEGAAGSSRDASVLTIRDLRDKLEAFEVIGPLAGKVLRRVLRVVATESPEKKEAFRALLAVDPAEIPSDVVVGVTVHDPRLS